MQYHDSQSVNWASVETLVKILAKKISNINKKFDTISTISRGGLVPSRLLADRLGFDCIMVDAKNIPLNSIFVDDIFDSGSTFKKIIPKVEDPKNFVFATLYARKGKKFPNQLIYAKQTKGNEYVVFPWDKLEHKRLKKLGL